jgi:hypothetical protein
MEHTNVTFNDNGTLTMVPRHPLVWVPELSAGKEDDVLVLPNIALLVSGPSRGSILLSPLGRHVTPQQKKTVLCSTGQVNICRNDHFCEIGQISASILRETVYVSVRILGVNR